MTGEVCSFKGTFRNSSFVWWTCYVLFIPKSFEFVYFCAISFQHSVIFSLTGDCAERHCLLRAFFKCRLIRFYQSQNDELAYGKGGCVQLEISIYSDTVLKGKQLKFLLERFFFSEFSGNIFRWIRYFVR